jgi:hypothetical protein
MRHGSHVSPHLAAAFLHVLPIALARGLHRADRGSCDSSSAAGDTQREPGPTPGVYPEGSPERLPGAVRGVRTVKGAISGSPRWAMGAVLSALLQNFSVQSRRLAVSTDSSRSRIGTV